MGKAAWTTPPALTKEGNGPDDIGVHVFPVRNADNEIVGYSINQESVDLTPTSMRRKRS